MTETEWMNCTDPQPMLEFLDGKTTNRKFWMFACGCCRQHPKLMADSQCRIAVETGERYADGQANADELSEACEEAFCRRTDLDDDPLLEAMAMAAAFSVVDPANRDSAIPSFTTASTVQGTSEELIHLAECSVEVGHDSIAMEKSQQEAADQERVAHCLLLRCVVGNPFRPVSIDHEWKNGAVVGLAQTIYDERAFDRLPALADSLEEAGCHDADLLAHCRQRGGHVRGCWVVDLLLGKE